jgi:hypothetical protein
LIRYVCKAVSFEKIIPQQYPEIVHLGDHPPKALKELWHGEKWRHTPQLNRPMERIYIDDSIKDAWVGDVFELRELTTGCKYAMYMGCIEGSGHCQIYSQLSAPRRRDKVTSIIILAGPAYLNWG